MTPENNRNRQVEPEIIDYPQTIKQVAEAVSSANREIGKIIATTHPDILPSTSEIITKVYR